MSPLMPIRKAEAVAARDQEEVLSLTDLNLDAHKNTGPSLHAHKSTDLNLDARKNTDRSLHAHKNTGPSLHTRSLSMRPRLEDRSLIREAGPSIEQVKVVRPKTATAL